MIENLTFVLQSLVAIGFALGTVALVALGFLKRVQNSRVSADRSARVKAVLEAMQQLKLDLEGEKLAQASRRTAQAAGGR